MAVFIESLPASYSWPAPLHSWADPGFWIWGATYWRAVGQSSICGSKPLIMFANWVGGAWPLPSPWIRPCLHCTALSVWPQPLTPKWTFRGGSLVFSNFFYFFQTRKKFPHGTPPSHILFGGTVLPSYVVFGGMVLPSYILFGGTVLPNNFTLN